MLLTDKGFDRAAPPEKASLRGLDKREKEHGMTRKRELDIFRV